MVQLYQFDFRVRRCIASGLIRRKSYLEASQNAEQVPHHLVIQCAFCYEVGFGLSRDTAQSAMLTKDCGDYQSEIYQELASSKYGVFNRRYNDDTYVALAKKGFQGTRDFSENFRGQIKSEKIKQEYYAEIMDAQSALGSDHSIVSLLKG